MLLYAQLVAPPIWCLQLPVCRANACFTGEMKCYFVLLHFVTICLDLCFAFVFHKCRLHNDSSGQFWSCLSQVYFSAFGKRVSAEILKSGLRMNCLIGALTSIRHILHSFERWPCLGAALSIEGHWEGCVQITHSRLTLLLQSQQTPQI